MNPLSAVHSFLQSSPAYFASEEYFNSTRTDFAQNRALPTCYEWNSEKQTTIKKISSTFFYPLLSLHKAIHDKVGQAVFLPASQLEFAELLDIDQKRKEFDIQDKYNKEKFRYKRFSIQVDGNVIDAALIGTEKTLSNGKWLLAANGNAQYYEEHLDLSNSDVKCILATTKANAIVFNYAGVGLSEGIPNSEMMSKVYRAFLNFLEDENGLKAKQIIAYGHSIGGAVVANAMKDHLIQKTENNERTTPTVVVISRAFSSVFVTAQNLLEKKDFKSRSMGYLMGCATQLVGWNMQTAKDLENANIPQIIIQTANVSQLCQITDKELIVHDGVISEESSLAMELIKQPAISNIKRTFIGIQESHNLSLINNQLMDGYEPSADLDALGAIINKALEEQSS